jgi:hypothetical protein
MTRTLFRLAVPCLAVAALLAHAAPAAAQTTLRYKFRDGQTLNYVVDMKMAMKIKADCKEVDMTMVMSMDLSQRTAAVNRDGTARIVTRVTRIGFKADFLGQKLEYDTNDGKLPDAPGAEALAVLKEITLHDITETQDTRGQTTDLKIPDKLVEALKKADGGGGQIFSEADLKKLTEQAVAQLPQGAVSRGDRWTQKLTATKTGELEMAMDNVSTYEGPVTRDGKNLEHISLKPTITVKPGPNAPADLKVKDITAKGAMYFDNVAGRLHSSDLTMDMDIEAPQVSMRMNIVMGMKLKR